MQHKKQHKYLQSVFLHSSSLSSSIFLKFYHMMLILKIFLLNNKIILKTVWWICDRINTINMFSRCFNIRVVWHPPYLYWIIYHIILMLRIFHSINKFILNTIRGKCNIIYISSMSSQCFEKWVVWHPPYFYSFITWCWC